MGNNSAPSPKPFKSLGNRIKQARQKSKESLAEVSGAVEIDTEVLDKIEQGEQRPTEEILLLLISHLNVQDDEATSLWEMAAYDKINDNGDQVEQIKQTALSLPMDIRIVYTDMVHVMVNDYGVVMNFMQNGGPNNQPLAVGRVGMSKEHAQSVLQVLQQTLAQADQKPAQKHLPSPKTRKEKTDK
ncbi:MAG TPA: helix-turn-helix domain-containing protein [Candidatus Saccharimonadales bacterium]|nr:helix-turn-helix domain-containing protein [Candidatus Saccharimonadales bacterium]